MKNLKNLAVLGSILAALSFTLFLIFRSEITFLGSWIVTISAKKFAISVGIYVVLLAVVLFLSHRSKLTSIFVLFMAIIGLFSAHSDFYSVKGGKSFLGNDHTYVYMNNGFLEETVKIRSTKRGASTVTDLWQNLCFQYEKFCSNEDISTEEKVEKVMLIVSAFFDYGNKTNTLYDMDDTGGCVGFSEETDFQPIDRNFDLYKRSEVGCCNDFAYLTASFLNYLSIKNDLVLMPGHIANVVYVDDKEIYIDANTNLMIENYRNKKKEGKTFYIYPHPNVSKQSKRYSMLNFQNQLIENFSLNAHFLINYLQLESSKEVDLDFLH